MLEGVQDAQCELGKTGKRENQSNSNQGKESPLGWGRALKNVDICYRRYMVYASDKILSMDWLRKSLRDDKSALGNLAMTASRAVLRNKGHQYLTSWERLHPLLRNSHQILGGKIMSQHVEQFFIGRVCTRTRWYERIQGSGHRECWHSRTRALLSQTASNAAAKHIEVGYHGVPWPVRHRHPVHVWCHHTHLRHTAIIWTSNWTRATAKTHEGHYWELRCAEWLRQAWWCTCMLRNRSIAGIYMLCEFQVGIWRIIHGQVGIAIEIASLWWRCVASWRFRTRLHRVTRV